MDISDGELRRPRRSNLIACIVVPVQPIRLASDPLYTERAIRNDEFTRVRRQKRPDNRRLVRVVWRVFYFVYFDMLPRSCCVAFFRNQFKARSEEHTSELQ